MKKLLIAFLLLSVPVFAATLQASFSYDYTGVTVCSSTVTNNCLDHFEIQLADGGTAGTPLPDTSTLFSVANPATVSGVANLQGSGSVTQSQIGYGSHAFALIAVAKDSSGNRVVSEWSQAKVSVNVQPVTPGGFVIVGLQ